MLPVNTCTVRVGRLMEIDVAAGYPDVAAVDDMIAQMATVFNAVSADGRIVIAADWRPCELLGPDVAERVVEMLERANRHVIRSAILHRADNPLSVLQCFRLAKMTGVDHRRTFRHPHEMELWLGECLEPLEVARLQQFLAQRRMP